jgi:hypothetical protein
MKCISVLVLAIALVLVVHIVNTPPLEMLLVKVKELIDY